MLASVATLICCAVAYEHRTPSPPTRTAAPAVVATTRRAALLATCGCCALPWSVSPADALAKLVAPPSESLERYDLPRDARRDRGFALGMATGMADYERAVATEKAALFDKLFAELPRREAVVVELGMGSFPNAPYYAGRSTATKLDLIGVDPNDSMEKYARRSAEKAELLESGVVSSLRVVHGVAEALPLPSASADAVVCTLTLCSVVDQERALAEVRRILKPGGKFLFHEHVLSETDDSLASQQRAATPMQVAVADGCHLDRRTLEAVRHAGFASVDARYYDLSGFFFLNPTVSGIATL